jgi:hypothetical protein
MKRIFSFFKDYTVVGKDFVQPLCLLVSTLQMRLDTV